MISLRDGWPFDRSRSPWREHYPAGVPFHLHYPHWPLGWLLEKAATDFPDRIACHYYEQHLTYQELLSRARRFAAVLIRDGLQPGDRVGILLPNLPEYLVTIFGTWMAGGVVVALSPLMVRDEVTSLISATGCRIVVTMDLLAPLACGSNVLPASILVTSLSNRLPSLERLGYAWIRFRKVGLHPSWNGIPHHDFDEAVANATDRTLPPRINRGNRVCLV